MSLPDAYPSVCDICKKRPWCGIKLIEDLKLYLCMGCRRLFGKASEEESDATH